MADFTTLGIRIDSSQVRQSDKDLNRLANSEKKVTKTTLDTDKAFKAMASTLSVLALFQTAKNLTSLADKMNLLDSRIKVATKSIEDYTKASKLLVDLSLRTGTSFEANTTIFVRTNKAIESLGGSIHTTARFTETLAKSLVISGTTAGETTSVIRQMSQALASGVLRGDEFNSISENGARIQQLLTESLGVTAGELRTMAEHGELTSQKVINAMLAQSKVIDEEYSRMPQTVGRAIENINTAFSQYIMLADRGSGATADIADHLDALAKNMIPIIDGIVTLGKVAVAVFAGKMVTSIAAVTAARVNVAAAAKASALASKQDAIASVASAEASLADANAKTAEAIASANHATNAYADATATLAQAQATLASTRASIAMYEVMTGQIASTVNLEIAEKSLAVARTANYTASLNEAKGSAAVTVANEAEATAKGHLIHANSVLNKQVNGVTENVTLATRAFGLLNVAVAVASGAFIGWEIGKWARGFQEVRTIAAAVVGDLAIAINAATFAWQRLLNATGQISESHFKVLEDAHNKESAALIKSVNELVAYESSVKQSNEAIAAAAKITALKAAADKKAADDAAKLKKSIDDMYDSLIEENIQLSLSSRAYEVYRISILAAKAELAGLEAVNQQELIALWDANQAITANNESREKSSDSYKEQQESIQAVIDSLIDENLKLSINAEEYQRVTLAKQGLTGADLEMAMALVESNARLEEQNELLKEVEKITLAARSPQDIFIAKSAQLAKVYNTSDLSLKAYTKTLNKYQKELDKSNSKKTTKDIDKYSDSLKDIDKRLGDIGATSLDIFSGPAEGINGITQALLSMTDALAQNNRDIEDNADAYMDYIFTTNDALDERIKKTKDFQKRQDLLEEKATATKIQSIGIVSQAISGALSAAAAEAEEGSKKQEALQKAAIGMQMVTATALGAVAVIRGFAEGGFPLAIATAAAVAVQLGVLGAQIAQVGGGVDPSEVQKNQGRGTILGDEDAMSESLSNSMELLEDYANIGNEHTSKMLISLQNIDNNTKELGKEVISSEQFSEFLENPLDTSSLQSGNVVSLGRDEGGYFEGAYQESGLAKAINDIFTVTAAIFTGGLGNVITEAIGGGNQAVKQVGLSIGAPEKIGDFTDKYEFDPQTLGEILQDGAEVYYYAIVDQFTSIQGLAKMDSFTANVFAEIEGSVSNWFNDIIVDMTNVLLEGANVLAPDRVDGLTQQIMDIELPVTGIDLKGLDDEETQEAVSGVLSALADDITEELFPITEVFQQAGEGLFETFARVTAETESASTALASVGLTAIKATEVLNKQNDIAPQIVRQTIAMNEEFSAVGEIMKFVTGDAEELISTYKDLTETQLLLMGTGLGIDTLSSALVASSGGEGELQSSLSTFSEDFFTEQEQFDMNLSNMQRSFSDLGLVMPVTKDAFRELVQEIGASGDDKLLGLILQLTPAISELSDDFDNLGESSSELAKILADVQRDFDRLNQSDFEATLRGISDSFVETLGSVMDAGGSVDDLLFVTNIGIQTGINAIDKAKDEIAKSFDDLAKTFKDRQNAVTMDMARIEAPNAFDDIQRQALEQQLITGDYDEQLAAADALQSMIMSNYDEQLSSVESLGEAIANIQVYIDGLLLNSALSTLTPIEMLSEARTQFNDTLALAQTGDIEALNSITGISDEYLTQAREFYASSTDYTNIFDGVLRSLEELTVPDGINYEQLTANASMDSLIELQGISEILYGIEAQGRAELQAQVFAIDEETTGIYREYINAVSSLTGYLSSDIETGLAGLPKFANGGIATSPSIVSEYGQAEAVIPIPSGYVEARVTGVDANKSYAELIAEIKGLREDVNNQTETLVETNYDANSQGAEQVSDAITEQGESVRWDDNKVEVV